MAEVPPPLLVATSEIPTSVPAAVLSGGFFGGKTADETILVAVKDRRVDVKL